MIVYQRVNAFFQETSTRFSESFKELSYIKALYTALQSQFGDSRVRLLVLVDLQDFEQDVVTLDLGPDAWKVSNTYENKLGIFSKWKVVTPRFVFATVIVMMVVAFGLLIVWSGRISHPPSGKPLKVLPAEGHKRMHVFFFRDPVCSSSPMFSDFIDFI